MSGSRSAPLSVVHPHFIKPVLLEDPLPSFDVHFPRSLSWCKSLSSVPIRALWAGLALGIINALLMWTADEDFDHDHRSDIMLTNTCKNIELSISFVAHTFVL
jgi:hypothetical protein